jgi:hypothetical protein
MSDRPPPKARSRFPRASYYNQFVQFLRSLGVAVRYPLKLIPTSRGAILSYDDPQPRIYARVTSAQAADLSYNFRQVYRVLTHAFKDGTLTGKFWELNDNAALTVGDKIELTKDTTCPDWIGQLDHC